MFDRSRLPAPLDYFEGRGLKLVGRGTWRTTRCEFHGGSDSMRVNIDTGGWRCMNCGEHGGDVIAYQMRLTGCTFVDACKALGAWVDGPQAKPQRRMPVSRTAAVEQIHEAAHALAVGLADVAAGRELRETDRRYYMATAARCVALCAREQDK
jgi:hypothetical protein